MAENTLGKAEGASKGPSDALKVQPKKETVRINLPPKPTAAPTVKIPAPVPAGGAKPAPAASAAPVARPIPTATAAATQKLPAAPAAVSRVAAPSVAPRPAPAMAPRISRSSVPAISNADKGLAIAAVVLLALIVARLFWLGN